MKWLAFSNTMMPSARKNAASLGGLKTPAAS